MLPGAFSRFVRLEVFIVLDSKQKRRAVAAQDDEDDDDEHKSCSNLIFHSSAPVLWFCECDSLM